MRKKYLYGNAKYAGKAEASRIFDKEWKHQHLDQLRMLQKGIILTLLLGLSVIAEEAGKRTDEQAFSLRCPPGYWCKRKREFDSAECPQGFLCQSKRSNEVCPPGYWCRRSELVRDEETDPESCPPGYWCKRRSISSKLFRGKICPPGFLTRC